MTRFSMHRKVGRDVPIPPPDGAAVPQSPARPIIAGGAVGTPRPTFYGRLNARTTLLGTFLTWLAFVCTARADSVVVFNEIMYHPLTNDPALEWLELHNQHAVDVDMSGWRLDGAVHFTFAEGSIIPRGGYLVVALSPAAWLNVTPIVGPFTGRLSNAGERLQLKNNNERLIDEVIYGSEIDWPVAPDGAGPSLAKRARNLASADPRSWRASAELGGTPGAENFPITPPSVLLNRLVAIETFWKFDDTDADRGTGWRETDYDDSGWASGSALFYLGDAPLPAIKNTPLASGRVTYYFRRPFLFTGETRRLQLMLRPIVDDGAVGYLNGVEAFRINLPPGPVNAATLASSQVGDAVFDETILLPLDLLRPGTNVLAVEVHQGPSFAAYAVAVLGSAPVGYWRLGEPGGTAFNSGSHGIAPPFGAQNGHYAGFLAANLAAPGPRPSDTVNSVVLAGFEAGNAAPRFAGNSDGGNDVVTIPDPGALNFAGTRTFTLEAWVNGGSGQEDGAAIIAKGNGGGGEQFALDVVGGRYRFFCWDGGNPNTVMLASAAVGPNNTWQHVAAVLDQPAGRMKIYVNGVERGSATPRPTLVNTPHEISIGARKNSGSSSYDLNFAGRIDEVAIYNRALSTNELNAHFNAAFTNNGASGPDTNDVVFGLELVAAETLPEAPQPNLAFNEFSSATNLDFWVELSNPGATNLEVADFVLVRMGSATNGTYVLPPQSLAPGELRLITQAEMGLGAEPGDRLVLYGPGRTNVFDAIVAKREPRARYPDGAGRWLFPAALTPGASNQFAFRDELVINEIMFHHRELPSQPATFSPTNVLLGLVNTWRYHASGVDLGSAWPAPAYDDSAWLSSLAMFYAPTSGVVLPAPKNTLLPLTNNDGARILTYYFRAQFQFEGDTNGLTLALRHIVDDGAVFYLNGVEVFRLNLPAGPIIYTNLATANVGIPALGGPVILPAGLLRTGLNTLAVEVHQVTSASSDMDFATELLAWKELSPALPFRDSPESWVEIFNRSSNAVNLTGWRLDEGIDLRFPSNKVIAPGGFIVVAKDPAHLQSLYPGIDVVGPFTNKLSKKSDLIALKDPNNNPADEVRYFEGGRWPAEADGGGSSLELRDPFADNAQPEAWAASDETGKGVWQTYTWRGIAQAGQAGEPTLWREFALCLVDGAGEALLDDIQVIETPSTAPKGLLYNGGFSGGSSTHWRFLGNHRHSRVEPETGNAANHVLRLIATGPGEYQGNQIETTLTNNLSILNGREYEISFRAKWLAGNCKLNARLYFNRLARTVSLVVPERNGTPGTVNLRFAGNIGPTFANFAHAPVVPSPHQPITVSVEASDPDGVAMLTLWYSVNGGAWTSAPMADNDSPMGLQASRSPYHAFTGTIPGQSAAALVQFYVQATDLIGTVATFPARGTHSRALYLVQDGQAATNAGSRNFRILMTAADAAYLHSSTNTLSNELLGCTIVSDEREVFYDTGVRLKGSFVGRNVPRVGFHAQFHGHQLFRGAHRIVSVDRAQHTLIGGVGEIVVKHIAAHAGGIPDMHDDLAHCIGPLPGYAGIAQLRLTGFDNDYLDAQFQDGSDGPMFEVEVLRWNLATVGGNPENPKQVGNESGGTGYANLEVQNYGDHPENYRWFFLLVNNRSADDFSRGMALSQLFSLTGANFDAQSRHVLDVEQWLRAMAYQQLVGPADAYFTGANIHNFRIYVRPQDQRVLYLPWDWDSSFLRSTAEPLYGSGNITKLLANPNNRRAYLHHLHDLLTTTFNTAYLARWTAHYGAVAGQDLSGILSHISGRASFASGQLPTAAAFAITSNGGTNFNTASNILTLIGTAPISIDTIEVNELPYSVNWTSPTNWTLTVPLYAGANRLVVQGVDDYGRRPSNRLDTITVTNTGPGALLPVVINEWMADNAGPGGLADPADGLFQDWFELFNPNTNVVNLAGFHLTDTLGQPTQWQIPTNTIIAPRGFIRVWADDDTVQNGLGADLHANFRLNVMGEAIGLFAPDGVTPQHTVVFGPQFQNVSQGLFPDGDTNAIYFMTNWTPRAANQLGLPAAPRITAITVDPQGVVALAYTATPGRTYGLQYKENLSAPLWSSLGAPQTALSPVRIISDNLPQGAQRFYRIVLVP